MIFNAKNGFNCFEQVVGCCGHHNDGKKVEHGLGGEFNTDWDIFVVGEETLQSYHNQEKRYKKEVGQLLFAFYTVKLIIFFCAYYISYLNLHFVKFKGNLG